MEENIIEYPMIDKIKNVLKKPLIICVTPEKKATRILKAEDTENDTENDPWNSNPNTGWSSDRDGSGCSPCCKPCAPCGPNSNLHQCKPDDDSCYPECSPCNPCYPCNPVEEYNEKYGRG